MKKVLLAVAAVAFVFGMASCDKHCKCKTYAAGVVVSENEITLDKDNENIKRCSDLTTIADLNDELKTGVECK